MLNIYLKSADTSNWINNIIFCNNSWFDAESHRVNFQDKNIIEIIKRVDGVSLVDASRGLIKSKFIAVNGENELTSVLNVSTGCKTCINLYTFPDKIFYGMECGRNALSTAIDCGVGNMFIDSFIDVADFNKPVQVTWGNNKKIFHNRTELLNFLEVFYNLR